MSRQERWKIRKRVQRMVSLEGRRCAIMEIQFWYELESNGREWRGQVYNDMVLEGEGITTEWYEQRYSIMGTRGIWGFYKDGVTKATYNHMTRGARRWLSGKTTRR
jgi:hypothetical protein